MTRIFITSTIQDARAKVKRSSFVALGLSSKLGGIRLADVYTIDAKLDKKQIEKAQNLLANPITQKASLSAETNEFSFAVEIGFLPGVTDNAGHTAKETLADGAKIKFKPGQNVYTSQVFFISGPLSKNDANKIAASLHNPLIQRATVTSFKDFKKHGLTSEVPRVKIKASNKVVKVNLEVADEELTSLGKLGILNGDKRQGPLALSLEELKAIKEYFTKLGRQPTDIEMEALAQTWSEHCKHTLFADPIDEVKDGLFKHYIKRATDVIRKNKGKDDFCVSVFSDNAGGISFDKEYIISHKVETHNTPSALDPFGGAITGIVGVNRDALGFGLGSKPVANFYGFCLAEPGDETKLYRDKDLSQPMLSARRIMDGVISGINAGGNQSGIPTPLGFLYFDSRYRGKPLVFAGTVGLIPKKVNGREGHEKKAQARDYIVMIGGRVGLDGIHGATFSSESLDTHSPAAAVQIGDPITQKKFSDAICKEARDLNLYNSITDFGAGGLSGGIGEMAKEAGGFLVNLDKVPLKYPGLSPWQIWISESQERMVLSVPQKKWLAFSKLMKARGVEATTIGEFNDSGKALVKYNGKTVLDLDMDFLHNGRPKKKLKTQKADTAKIKNIVPKNIQEHILNLLSHPNITSTEFVSRQYDHEVQGSSITKPLQGKGRVNIESAVIRPVLSSKKGVVLSYGLNPSLSETDPYAMAASSIDSAIGSAVAAGANVDYLALLDNSCWCSPDDPKRLWQLKQAIKACYDTAVAFGTPFISGKDSMHNDFKGFGADGKALKISIPPTLLISTLGVIPDAEKAVTIDAKIAGDFLYILGETKTETVPKVNTEKNLKLYRQFYQANQKDLIASAISLGRGGLAVALSKKLIAGGLGAEMDLSKIPGKWKEVHEALFAETQGRLLVTVDPNKAVEFEKIMEGIAFAKIGSIKAKPELVITNAGEKVIKLGIDKALKAYKSTFKYY